MALLKIADAEANQITENMGLTWVIIQNGGLGDKVTIKTTRIVRIDSNDITIFMTLIAKF